MTSHSRSSSFAASVAPPSRRPSASSRLSYAVSAAAERGETNHGHGHGNAAEHHQIEEEIAEIKRYEVCPRGPPPPKGSMILPQRLMLMCAQDFTTIGARSVRMTTRHRHTARRPRD